MLPFDCNFPNNNISRNNHVNFLPLTRLNNSTISNNSIRSTLYRIVLTTLVFCLSDFADIIAHVFRAALLQTRSPMMIVINLSINTLTLMCSYEDYRMRIFPFICSFKPTRNNLGKAQVNQRSSENGRATNYMKDKKIVLKVLDTSEIVQV